MPIARFLQRALALAALACVPARAAPPLPALGADLGRTTVSGVSSGAYMAGQFGVAYSSMVTGVALVAGGPYYCAGEPDDVPPLWNALGRCTNPAVVLAEPPDGAQLWARAQAFARIGLVDDTALLARQSVFIFSGERDELVSSDVALQARVFYTLAGVARLAWNGGLAAGHGMITDRAADSACEANTPPYFNNCHYRLAEQLLGFLYPTAPALAGGGAVLAFDQRRFAPLGSGLADEGFVFVPDACRLRSCPVHVAFHGCYQSAAIVGDHFYRGAEYNGYAARHGIIVLYPQAESSEVPYNPLACWDYWGYSGPGWYTRFGVQLVAVRSMLERLGQPAF
ncbi:MAG: extracellular catalytic domain type 2 short-chain-length polyhydroxyalkanoate depolymerase [Telluria sp.]